MVKTFDLRGLGDVFLGGFVDDLAGMQAILQRNGLSYNSFEAGPERFGFRQAAIGAPLACSGRGVTERSEQVSGFGRGKPDSDNPRRWRCACLARTSLAPANLAAPITADELHF
jgi:hypothetical protein